MSSDRQVPAKDKAQESPVPDEGFVRLPRRQVILTLAGVMTALFLAALDQTIVGTAMPRIIADLNGFDRYTWVSIAYMLSSTTVVPIAGKLSDMYGRKWFLIGGITVFLVGSALAGLSQNMMQLIMFRGVQGLGGGIMMALSFVTIADLFPPAERGKYQGLFSAVFGLSSVVGPTLGGVITDSLSWHWIFYINLPLGIPALVLFVRTFPNKKSSGIKHQVDSLGMVTLILTVVPLLLGLSWGSVQYAWGSAQVVSCLVLAGVSGVAFFFIERGAPEPIIPFSLFRVPQVRVSLAVVFLIGFALFGGLVFIPLYFQGVLGRSATSSGSFLIPMTLGVVVGAALSGQALSRLGGHYRILGMFGVAILSVGLYLLSTMNAGTSFGQAILYTIVMGFGAGVGFPLFTIAVQNAVPHRVVGVATSSIQFVQSLGGTLGLTILGAMMVDRFSSHLAKGVSADVQAALPQGMLSSLTENPQALVSPQAQEQLQQVFAPLGADGATLFEKLLTQLKDSLSSSLSDVFLVALVLVAVAFLITVFLKDIPLRTHTEGAPVQQTAADGGNGTAGETKGPALPGLQ
ncbi:MAG: DHA2 family efflux MFS transporter permease subunit [Dehalococcoidia bacterium]|nr:DHA2 family efflux MFS transporter permease subunit [Dehalococcoidia bacterium]